MDAPVIEYLTIGDLAAVLGITPRQIRSLWTRGLLPAPARIGRERVIHIDDLPAVEQALREAGYSPRLGRRRT